MDPTVTNIPPECFRITAPGACTPGSIPLNEPEWDGLIFILCLGGRGRIEINNRAYPLGGNTLVSIMPHQCAELFAEEGFRCSALAFTFDFMSEFPLSLKPHIAEKATHTPCLRLTREQKKLLSEYHALILSQYGRSEHPSRPAIIKSLLFNIMAEISYIYSGQTVTPSYTHQEAIVHHFFGLLHTHCLSHRETSFYAGKLCLTPKHLSATIKRVTGKSLRGWITEFVVKEAKRMLQTTDLTVNEISDRLRFPNASFFGRYFKKYAGTTPLQFRKQNGK